MFLVPTTRLLRPLRSFPYRYTSIPHTKYEKRLRQPVLPLTLATELNRKGISLMWIITLKIASWDMNTKHGICLMFTCRKGTQTPEGYFGTLMENISGGAWKTAGKGCSEKRRGNPMQATFLKHHLRAKKPNSMIYLHLKNTNASPTFKTCDGVHSI